MGANKSAASPGDDSASITKSITRNFTISMTRGSSVGALRGNDIAKKRIKEDKEREMLDTIIKSKNSILKTNIMTNATKRLKTTVKTIGSEELEKMNLTKDTESLTLSGLDFSNSKIYERLITKLKILENLTELTLSDCSLTEIPHELPSTLVKLVLKENMIQELPMLQLPLLSHLDISYNCITSVPIGLGESITYLDLRNNKIADISDEIMKSLISLQNLNLSGNALEKIEFYSESFSCLYSLNLSFNRFYELPGVFFSPSISLIQLNLSNTPMVKLHPKIGLLGTLVRLDLRSTKLTELPSTISFLINLEYLFLDKVPLIYPPLYEIMKYLKEKGKDYGKEMDLEAPGMEKIEAEDDFVEPLPELGYRGYSSALTSSMKSPVGTRMASNKSGTLINRSAYYAVKSWIDSKTSSNEDLVMVLV